ncbi:MAG: IS21 family transposase [bacterium]|nr:IS21 family transposase [bacterium]
MEDKLVHEKSNTHGNEMLTPHQQITIHTLFKQGKEIKEIAESLGVHRNTVKNILQRGEIRQKQERIKHSSFATYQKQIEDFLTKKITRLRIWQILKDEYAIEAGYYAFCKYLKTVKKNERKVAFVVQENEPGELAEVDFGYAGLIPKGAEQRGSRDTTLTKVWFFIMTLSYSRDAYYEAVTDQKVETFIQCHLNAFQYFGGVPKEVKIDNLKSGILRNEQYSLEYNQHFLDCAYYAGFIIKPCTPYHPNQKGKVENGVGYVKKNFLGGRTFADLQDFKHQLRDWMHNVANVRIHGTTKQIPHEILLSVERQALQPLPQNPFPTNVTLRRKVKLNCHIQYDGNYYSVPSPYVGEMVDVRKADNLLKISIPRDRVVSLNDLPNPKEYGNIPETSEVEIATHIISAKVGTYITNPHHFPEHKIYSQTAFQQKYEDKMKNIGENVHAFFTKVLLHDKMSWQQTIRSVLGLVPLYGKEKVDKACKRALQYNAFKYRVIKNICEKGLENVEIDPTLPKTDTKKDHGLDRDLSYYEKENGN